MTALAIASISLAVSFCDPSTSPHEVIPPLGTLPIFALPCFFLLSVSSKAPPYLLVMFISLS